MLRENYFYNRNQQNRNLRRSLRRRAKKVISIVALAATLVTSIPFAAYTDAYAKGQTTLDEMKALSIPTENAITYNLADASLITNKTFMDYYGEKMTVKVIEINITKDGNYVITGSNEINGELIDTHITVAEGVEANITFDGATIKNQTKYAVCSQMTSIIYNPIFPVMDIFGNANIYVESDSELMSAAAEENPVIRVTGEMTVKDSEAVLKLTPRADENNPGEGKMVICGNMTGAIQPAGSLTVEGGNLDVTGYIKSIDKFTMTGGKIASTCRYADVSTVVLANDITIAGGIWDQNFDAMYGKQSLFEAYRNIQVSGGNIQIRWLQTTPWDVVAFSSPSTHIIGGNLKLGDGFVLEDTLDAYGNETKLFDLTGLPKNADVEEVNGYPVEGIQTTSDGEWKNAALPCCSNLIKMKNGKLYKFDYKYDSENQKGTMVADTENSPVVHDVTLKLTEEDGTPIGKKEIQAVDGFTMKSEYYDGKNYYTYVDDTGKQLSEIRIESRSELTLKKSSTVTLDGKPFAGEVLPSDSMYMWKKNDHVYAIFYPGDPIPSGNNIVLERVPSVQKNGEWYVKLQSEKDVMQIQDMMQIDNTINVLLDADFDYNKVDTYLPGLLGWTKYYGVFDGNNHTISNVRRSDTGYEVIALQNFGTIKNVHVKNISDKCYGEHTRQGIVCGDNYGIVENCSVENAVIGTVAQEENSIYGKVTEYGALVGGNFGTIRGCFASDITFDGEGVTWPLAHEFPYSTIENTYYEAEVESGDAAKTAEQFASGEVCSLLNKGVTDGSQIWYQNIDNDAEQDAAPVADTSHGTVYYGYQGCKTMGYSNTRLPDTPRHKLNYTAEGNVLTGVCTDDPSHRVTITLTAEDAKYDGKEHKAVLNKTYSDTWKEAATDGDAKIIYTRDGKPTTDLTSAGTIKASVTMGDAAAEVIYTIKVTPTPTPTATPMASPSAAPSATPTVSPSVVPSAGPTATPAGTNPGSVPSADPSAVPTKAPGTPATPAPSSALTPAPASEQSKQPQASESQKSEPKGSKLKKNGNKYMVTSASKKTPTIKYTGSSDKTKKKVIIPKTVTIDGVEYKVTSIGKKAFRNNKSLKEVVIGKNITKIETKAFYGCKNLRKVTFQTTTLSKKSVGKNAFGKINNRASYLIPSEKLKKYKRWLKKRGAIKQQIFRKY